MMKQGVVVVNSIRNEKDMRCNRAPASMESVIVVGGVGRNGEFYDQSSFRYVCKTYRLIL
jgi:hypothetical protein